MQFLIDCAPSDSEQFGTAHWSQTLSRELESPRHRVLTITLPDQKSTLGSVGRRRRHSAPFFHEMSHHKNVSSRDQKAAVRRGHHRVSHLLLFQTGPSCWIRSAGHVVNLPNVRGADSRNTLLASHLRGSKCECLGTQLPE